jgi:A/G-specific adenine glycosylase
MDLGATVCVKGKPRCDACPVSRTCVARKKGLTAKLPAPRPKKAIPSRSTTWLVLRHAGQVLLERRPSPGIWGGLWSFPEASGKDIAQDCRNLGYRVRSMRDLDQIEHGFTHFRLTIQPVLCEVSEMASGVESPGRLWLDIAEAGGAATPAPVKKLLQSFA